MAKWNHMNVIFFDTVPPTMHTPNDAPVSLFNSTCTLFPQPISNCVCPWVVLQICIMQLVVSSMTGQLVYLILNIEYVYEWYLNVWVWIVQNEQQTPMNLVYDMCCMLNIYFIYWIVQKNLDKKKQQQQQNIGFHYAFTFIFVESFFVWSCDCHTASERESTCGVQY